MHPTSSPTRRYVIYGLAVLCVAHVVIGLALPWIGNAAVLDAYHRHIEAAFWGIDVPAPAAARAQQIWWISLFGATLQSVGVWMLALVHLGSQYRRPAPWGWLMAGLLLWAPQDIGLSLQAQAWQHVLVDALALASMLPALVWLYWDDAQFCKTG